jgi:diguanylate cyclase (GGDEF)-like protein
MVTVVRPFERGKPVERFSPLRVRLIGKKTIPISVAERLLMGLLGPPFSTAHISTSEGLSGIDRTWGCGCQAHVKVAHGDVASWIQCERHEAVFLAKGVDDEGRSALARLRAILSDRRVKIYGAPVLGLGIAVIARAVYEANALLRRAEEAEGASLVDPLTGLYNRRGWDRRVEEERKRLKRDMKPVVAVYMLDVDGLKATNDERGHAAGDAILRHVSKVIREVTREHDVAARLGGDEFAILTVQSQAAEADLIRARLERGFHSAALSVSIGFAFANSVDTISDAMDRADIAMYEVKKNNAAQAVRHR